MRRLDSGRLEAGARRWSGCLLLIGLVALGCGSQPIPLSAQAGTTFVLMVPNGVVPGFGRGWSGEEEGVYPAAGPPLRDWLGGGDPNSSPDPSLEDLQRGELFLYAISPEAPSDVRRFPLAYMTRVEVARSSAAALARTRVRQDPTYTIDPLADNSFWSGQIIAFVDIPADTPTGAGSGGRLYDIYPQRRFRKVLDPHDWEEDPMGDGWNSGAAVQLRVLPADLNEPERFSDFYGATGSGWTGTEGKLKLAVPYPELYIDLATVDAEFELFRPAAAEIELEYPAGAVDIAGVALGKNNPSAAIVRWEIVPGPPPVSCYDKWTLRIYLIDPDELTGKLRVAFHHVDPSTCPYRVGSIDFSIKSWAFYDDAGSPETDPAIAPTIDAEIY